MLTIIRDRVEEMIGRGWSLEQVRAARPTSDYDGRTARPRAHGPRTCSWRPSIGLCGGGASERARGRVLRVRIRDRDRGGSLGRATPRGAPRSTADSASRRSEGRDDKVERGMASAETAFPTARTPW
jgi:hypothetical protein